MTEQPGAAAPGRWQPCHYVDDFEDEVVGAKPSHWVEWTKSSPDVETDKADFRIVQDGQSKLYSQKEWASGQEHGTYLHVFELNPNVRGRIRIDHLAADGHFAFYLRWNSMSSWLRIVYSAAEQGFYLSEREESNLPERRLVSAACELTCGTWYDFAIDVDERTLRFWWDGDPRELLIGGDLQKYSYGRVGIKMQRCALALDEFSYTGFYHPSDGVLSEFCMVDQYTPLSGASRRDTFVAVVPIRVIRVIRGCLHRTLLYRALQTKPTCVSGARGSQQARKHACR